MKRLLGMQFEYNKEYKRALELYDGLLASNPSNLLILKRKVIYADYSCQNSPIACTISCEVVAIPT